jgi:hypothetical protein
MRELRISEIRGFAMTRDEQVRELFSLLSSGVSLSLASLKTGMDEKTARTSLFPTTDEQ